DAALGRMNLFGRIPVCGMISQYTSSAPPPPFKNFRSVLVNRLTIRGFIVFDFIKDYPEAVAAMGAWHADGKLVMTEDVRTGGLDAFGDTLALLFTGGNFGKLVLEV
ncbi:MAG: NADP-dependent oxidoreductase, partial [Pseudomonadota bacterium]